MKVTSLTRRALSARRQSRDLKAIGYEEVGDRGGRLWELNRGYRQRHVITDAIIAADGKSLFVKIEPMPNSVAEVS